VVRSRARAMWAVLVQVLVVVGRVRVTFPQTSIVLKVIALLWAICQFLARGQEQADRELIQVVPI
jgi:hypothetical protein